MAELKDKHVVVLGGSSGIGFATAQACVAAGAKVTVGSRDPARVAAAARALGATSRSGAVDATSRPALDAFLSDLGGLDHLVLSVSGGGGAGPFRTLEPAVLRAAVEGKFWAYVNAVQAALPHLAGAGASVTFVTGGAARMASPGTAGLAASNGALNAMVGPLALELSPVRVNAVCPGIVTTALFERWPEDQAQAMADRARSTPAGRAGRAEEVARVVTMLIENEFMTGAVLDCDGGMRLRP